MFWLKRPYRLTVRTSPSHGGNPGSIPGGVTKARRQEDWTAPVFFAFVKSQACCVATAEMGRRQVSINYSMDFANT